MIRQRSILRFLAFALALTLAALFAACGGSGSDPPPPQISVAIHPQGGSVVVGSQTQQFSAAVTGDAKNLGLTWAVDSVTGGNSTVGTISTTGLYTLPASAGTHIVTAASVADSTKDASATFGVTDLAGIATYHYNLARDGVNSQEYALTTANVNRNTFGKLFSCAVDGAIYTEPLWAPALNVGGSVHNVVFVATQHDSLYAFDADSSPCAQLWHVNLIDTVHGGTTNETPVCWYDVGNGFQDIQPEIGVTGTPVIDLSGGTIYVTSKSETGGCATGSASNFHQRLHAISLATGAEKLNAPVNISATVAGTGDGSSGGVLNFNLQSHNFRSALMLLNGVVYICWASHEDAFPYHGWILGYNAANVQQQVAVFNTSPNGGLAGVWMAGGAPAADAGGNLYFETGNGTFDADQPTAPNNDYGDSILKLSTSGGLTAADYFTPNNQSLLNTWDADLGSGGVVLLPDQTGPVAHLLVGGGKEGVLYLVNRDNMGHFLLAGNTQIVQSWHGSNGSFSTPAFWQNTLYVAGAEQGTTDSMRAYSFNTGTGFFATLAPPASAHMFPFPGATPVVSSNGNAQGIVWVVDTSGYGVPSSYGTAPAVLYAFDATNVGTELWDSSQTAAGRDQAGNAVKFTVPTVANGKVYIGSRTELDVYGLLP